MIWAAPTLTLTMPATAVGKPAGRDAAGHLSVFLIERTMRDAKIRRIYEGANEMQKLILTKDVDARQECRA
jgi:alkylation response protein AidB-like acyl-CoA dehydrogenase